VPGLGGGRLGAPVEQVGGEGGHQVAVEDGRLPVVGAPGQVRLHPGPVDAQGGRTLALGPQVDKPGFGQGGQV
jgi:hypothetical protein